VHESGTAAFVLHGCQLQCPYEVSADNISFVPCVLCRMYILLITDTLMHPATWLSHDSNFRKSFINN
jgi:hypothetical protein